MAATIVTQQQCRNELASESSIEEREPTTFQMNPVVLTTQTITTPTTNANKTANDNIEKSQQETMMLRQVYDVEHLATFGLFPVVQNTKGSSGSSRANSEVGSCDDSNSKSNNSSDSGCITTSDSTATINDTTLGRNDILGRQLEQKVIGTNNSDKQIDDINHDNNYIATSRQQQQAPIRASDLKASSAEDALERLFDLEKLSGIWTQQMKLELTSHNNPELQLDQATDANEDNKFCSLAQLIIIDCETNTKLESFEPKQLQSVRAFKQYNDIYNNILLFIIKKLDKQSEEIHIFQCVSNEAQDIAQNIEKWRILNTNKGKQDIKSNKDEKVQPEGEEEDSTMNQVTTTATESREKNPSDMSSLASDNEAKTKKQSVPPAPPPLPQTPISSKPTILVASGKFEAKPADAAPLVNVNVKETVQVFNQIAAQREKR